MRRPLYRFDGLQYVEVVLQRQLDKAKEKQEIRLKNTHGWMKVMVHSDGLGITWDKELQRETCDPGT